MTTEQIFSESIKTLSDTSDSPSLDARMIISFVCSFSSVDFVLKKDKELEERQIQEIRAFVKERKEGKPVAYITGERAFFRDVFFTDSHVLIPQPDTETLVEKALDYASSVKKKKLTVLDLCAGTGCIGISFAKAAISFTDEIDLYLSDVSNHAFDCFSRNANLITNPEITTHLCLGDLFESVRDLKFDIILTNPPYIESSTVKTLDKDVLAQPILALDGGADGLEIIRNIIRQSPLHLKNNSALFMEIGYNQKSSVTSLFNDAGFTEIQAFRDLGNNFRVVKGLLKR